MPKCVDCGTETDRSVMYGPNDELRCPACVRKLQEREYEDAPVAQGPPRPYLTMIFIMAAIVATLYYWREAPFTDYLREKTIALWDGEAWRFVTSAFLHGDILHLIFNLYWLWRFGMVLEDRMGHLAFAGLFLLCTVGASAAQFLLSGPSIGLSGFGYGMFGFLYALRKQKDFAAELMQPGVIQVFVVWFFICVVAGMTNLRALGDVANVAHGAGAVIGWLVGQSLLLRRWYVPLAGIVLVVVVITGAAMYQPWNPKYVVYRAYSAEERGDYGTALYWFRKCAIEYPDDLELKQRIRWLEDKVQKPHS